MKASTILLILMFLVTFVPFNIGGDDVVAFDYDRLSNEGYVAHVVNESNWDSVPDDEQVDGPHEDPDKCVCKGTGKITHGDGHQTPCPYHGDGADDDDGSDDKPTPDRTVSCECNTSTTYCNCKAVHGECPCPKRPAAKGDENPIGKTPVSKPLEEKVNEASAGKHTDSGDKPTSNTIEKFEGIQKYNRLPKVSNNPIVVNTPEPFNGMVSPFAATHFTKERQVIMFTASWCGPCISWKENEKPQLIAVKWIVSEKKDAHIRMIDIDASEENAMLYERYGEGFVPSFHLFLKGEKRPPVNPMERPAVGYHTAKQVSDLYYAEGGKK